MEDKYVLKVRNPRGVRKEKIQGLTAPRISSIEGKRIAIMYTLGYLYEHREKADMHELALTLRSLLFSIREGVV